MQAPDSFEPEEATDGDGGDYAVFVRDLEVHLDGLRAKAARLETASDREDLVQDTIERALRSRHRFVPGTNLRSWLHTIMHNLFLDRCRARNRRHLFAIDVSLPDSTPEEGGDPQRWELVSLPEVQDINEHLSRPLREAARLVLFEGLSYDQASLRLAVPRATVGTRLLRARRQLRRMIEERLVAAAQRD